MKQLFLDRKIIIRDIVVISFSVFLIALFEFVGWFDNTIILGTKWLIPLYTKNTEVVLKLKAPVDFIRFSFNKTKYLKQLEGRYAQSQADLSELDKLRSENEELRALIENKDRRIEKTIIGAPIVSLAYPAVGVGSVDGVDINDMVLLNNVLIGTIEDVDKYQSKLSLLSQQRKKKILVKTESGVEGVVDGNGRNVLIKHVPRNQELKEGERVVTVGQEGIERDVFVGQIRLIDNSPSAPTQTAVVEQIVSFYDAILVEVK